jgi:hypothetical protein
MHFALTNHSKFILPAHPSRKWSFSTKFVSACFPDHNSYAYIVSTHFEDECLLDFNLATILGDLKGKVHYHCYQISTLAISWASSVHFTHSYVLKTRISPIFTHVHFAVLSARCSVARYQISDWYWGCKMPGILCMVSAIQLRVQMTPSKYRLNFSGGHRAEHCAN